MNENKFIKWTVQHFELVRDKKLRINDVLLWQWYLLQNPFEDRPVKMIFEMIERDTGLSKDAYYRSRQKLIKLGLIEIIERDTEATQGVNALRKNSESISENSENVRKNSESISENSETVRKNSESISENSENQELEANDSNGSTLSQTNSDLNILNKTYSEGVQINSDSRTQEKTTPTPKNIFCENFLKEELDSQVAEKLESQFQLESRSQVAVTTETKVVVEKPELKSSADSTKVFNVNELVAKLPHYERKVSASETSVKLDKGWSEFEWLDKLYQEHKPSCWKSEWMPKTSGILFSLKVNLKKLNGDVQGLKELICQAFARVQNKPSLWDYSLEWVLRPNNLETLAWEGASNLYAPSKKTEQEMKRALERKIETEKSRSRLEKLGMIVV
jgi:hypothetical protein